MNTKTEPSKWDRREVGALWTKLSKDKSQKYMTGHIQTSLEGKIDIVIFSNKEKKSDKSPDFRVYISDKEKKESSPAAVSAPNKASVASSAETQDEDGVL